MTKLWDQTLSKPKADWLPKVSILYALRHTDLLIYFTKKDGSERCLHATSNIPEDKRPKAEKHDVQKEESDKYVRLFDKNIQEWRTVIVSSIKEILAPPPENP